MSDFFVKVCGLMRPQDVVAAIDAGADAIGLSLVARSPRRIDPQRASELATVARGRAEIVLLVDADPEEAIEQARRVGATGVQPYGPRAAEVAAAAVEQGMLALLPLGVGDDEMSLEDVPSGAIPLLDTSVDGQHGGTGQTFDWNRASGLDGVIIAGGLNPENVAGAVATAAPAGVDASSGLEQEVGVKDHGKVSAFVAAAREAATRLRQQQQ